MAVPRGTRRLFVAGEQPRVRRASDVVVAALSVGLLVLCGLVALPPSALGQAVIDLLAVPPGWFDFLWKLLTLAMLAWPTIVFVAAVVGHRISLVRELLLGIALAAGVGLIGNRVIAGSWDSGLVLFGSGTTRAFPVLVLGVAAAVVAVARPQLTAPYRHLGRWVIVGGVTGSLLLATTTPVGALVGLLVGQLAAAIIHLVFGTDDGVPSPAEAAETVAALGVEVAGLRPARRQDAGVYVLEGSDGDGADVTVRLFGRDARDTQALSVLWRGLWYRGSGASTLGRTQRAEHEAFVTLRLAARGMPVPELLAAGGVENGDSAVVLRGRGRSLRDVSRSEVGEEQVARCWSLLHEVHDAGLAVGDLGRSTYMLSSRPDADPDLDAADGSMVMLDELPVASSAPSEADLRSDEAQLLVLSAVLLDAGRAVQVASDSIGDDRLQSVLPYVQSAALGPSLRREVRSQHIDVDGLLESAAAASGVEPPAVAKLRRVSVAELLRIALFAAIGYFLITRLAQVDFSEIISEFQDAEWKWLAVALVLGQMAIASQSVVTQGASPRHVPYGPLVVLQFAVAFVMLAVPSTAARIAVIVRFFQKQGVSASAAVSISLLDSFTGFIVQICVLVAILVFGLGGVDPHFSPDTGADGSSLLPVLIAVAGLVVVVVVVAVMVPRLRHWVLDRVSGPALEMWQTAKGVRTPKRLGQLFGGNFLTQLVYAFCLGACVVAFGGSDGGLAAMLVVYIAAALFGGFMPVPGGVGVVEAALVAGLTAVGVSSAAAVGAAISFRAVTFYLPPLWGAGATAWLRRSGDL